MGCLCEPGEVKDPITRKCVKYEECEKACIFNGVAYQEGEEYWKSDCSKCTCKDGHEKCNYDVCRLSQDVCDQQGQRFVHVTGKISMIHYKLLFISKLQILCKKILFYLI